MPFEQLRSVQGGTTYYRAGFGRPASVCTVIEYSDADSIRVVIQGFCPVSTFLPGEHVYVEGFEKHVDESVIELDCKELYDYT